VIYLTDYRTVCTENVHLLDDLEYPQRVHWFPESYAKVASGFAYAPHIVANKLLEPALVESIKNRGGRTAFILAAGNSHFAGINKDVPKTQLSYTYKFAHLTLTQVYAGTLARMFGAEDMVITDASACASSLKVMMDVQMLFAMYRFDRVIVLSVEDQVTNTVLKFFGESKAVLTKEQDDTGILPSAFDGVNYGFHIGQGAVLAVFENESHASNPAARLVSSYNASEKATNAIGQREDGEGFIKAAHGALRHANLSSRHIDVVKTHGTGTHSNNASERNALNTLFDHHFVATAFKPTIGHTMGASGLLETCLLLDSMKKGLVPAIANRTRRDHQYLSYPLETTGQHTILSLAAGMGNIYSAAIFDTQV